MEKFKKITFAKLKSLALKQEIEFAKEWGKDEELSKETITHQIQNLKTEFKEINSTMELVGYFEGEGFSTEEAYDIILKLLIK